MDPPDTRLDARQDRPSIPASTAPASQPRGWLATIGVAAVMLGIIGAGLAAKGLARGELLGQVEVARGVTITLPAGWEFGGRSASGDSVVVSRGSGSLAITVSSGPDEIAALNALRDEWVATGKVTTGMAAPIEIRPGQRSARFSYSGTFQGINSPVEGTVTGVRGTDVVVVFDGWSGFGSFGPVAGDIDRIVREAKIP